MARYRLYQPVADFTTKIALLGVTAEEFYTGAGLSRSTYYSMLRTNTALARTAVVVSKQYGELTGTDTATALQTLFLSPEQQALAQVRQF